MSGAGKSTLLAELRRRDHLTVDTDHDGWTPADGTWDERRMDDLLADHADVVVSGTVDNQGRFYDRFDSVVLLSAPLEVLLQRVAARADNPYGWDARAARGDRALRADGGAAAAAPRLRGARRPSPGVGAGRRRRAPGPMSPPAARRLDGY